MRVARSLLVLVALSAALVPWSLDARRARAEDATAAQPKPAPRAQCLREWTYAGDSDEMWNHLQSQLDKPAKALTVGPWQHNGEPASAQSIDALKGQIVLVTFWATWCRPCREAVPTTNATMDLYKDKGVTVIAVCNTNERNGGPMAEVAKKLNMKYPTAQDQSSKTAEAWGVKWWPYEFVIDRNGIVRGAGLSPSGAKQMIEALLKEQPKP